MCHCFCLCLRPEMKTEWYHIIMLEVINLLEGEREREEQQQKVGCGFKSQRHFQGPEINTCILFRSFLKIHSISLKMKSLILR